MSSAGGPGVRCWAGWRKSCCLQSCELCSRSHAGAVGDIPSLETILTVGLLFFLAFNRAILFPAN